MTPEAKEQLITYPLATKSPDPFYPYPFACPEDVIMFTATTDLLPLEDRLRLLRRWLLRLRLRSGPLWSRGCRRGRPGLSARCEDLPGSRMTGGSTRRRRTRAVRAEPVAAATRSPANRRRAIWKDTKTDFSFSFCWDCDFAQGDAETAVRHSEYLGWHYLSNAARLIRPHLFSTALLV